MVCMALISQKNWCEIFEIQEYLNTNKLAGYYNHNYMIESNGQMYILRIPIRNAESMDLRLIPESMVLRYLEKESFLAPRMIYENEEEMFFIHKYIEGKTFSHTYPENTSFPDWIPVNIANQMKKLHRLKPQNFVPYCNHIAKSPNSSGFFQYLIMMVEDIYEKFKKPYAVHFKKLQFPKDPFKVVKINSLRLKPRQFTLCHCDIHKKNLIISEENKNNLVILDWELALVADSFYDIATHFHKMGYIPSQEQLFLEHYLGQNREATFFRDSWDQIQIYLQLERVKSAIVDIVRMSQKFKEESSEKKKKFLAGQYQNILRKAWGIWGLDSSELSTKKIFSVLNL